jgi:NAD+ synthase (glutamine-hydrolysing)
MSAARGSTTSAEGVAVAVFPELTLSGYSIEDLLLQDALLDASRSALGDVVAGVGRPAAGARRRRAAALPQPDLQLRRRRSTAAGARRRAEVLPADLPRVLRAPPASPRATTSGRRRSARRETCRSAPTCCSRPTTCPGFVVHVEICEDMWVPVPPSAEAALAGATVLANLSGSPITVGRPRTAAAVPLGVVALPGRLRLRRRRARASRPPTWPGTARR